MPGSTTSIATVCLLLPEMILVGAALLLIVVGAFRPMQTSAVWTALAALVIAGIALFAQDDGLKQELWKPAQPIVMASGPLVLDLFSHTARWATLGIGIVLALLFGRSADTRQASEMYASLLLMLAGLMIVAAANELILLFVGLELISIPTYILLYVGRHDARGQEAASKYFFLSILSSALLLYGFSFLYGAGGSTRLEHIAAVLAHAAQPSPLIDAAIPLALLLIFAGLAFRLTAVPFHFYAPDVYQGTSNANSALLSTLPKIAGLLVLARILLTALPGWEALGWKAVLVISVLTMTVGNVLALWQNNVRRLLAYSSIAHAGYLLIGLSVALAAHTASLKEAAGAATLAKSAADTAGSSVLLSAGAGVNGLGSALFYLLVYMLATLGTFAALVYLSRGDRQLDTLDELAGLNRTHPVVALILAIFMFSLAGIPPLAGFWGKFSLLYGALTLPQQSADGLGLRPWFIGLSIVAVLNAAIAAAYYLRVIGVLYFRPNRTAPPQAARGWGPLAAMAICTTAIVGLGLLPGRFLDGAVRAGASISQPSGEASMVERSTGDKSNLKPLAVRPNGPVQDL